MQADESIVTGQQPQFDPAAFQATMQATIKETLGQMATDAQQAEQRRQQQAADQAAQQARQQQQASNPIAELLQPHISPVFNQASAATDAAVFYATNSNAAEYSGQVEQVVNSYLQQGQQAPPRATVWQWIQGSPDYQAELKTAWQAEQTAAQQAATMAQTVGVGSPGRQYAPPGQSNPYTMDPAALKALIDNVPF